MNKLKHNWLWGLLIGIGVAVGIYWWWQYGGQPSLIGKWAVVSVEENGVQVVSAGSSAMIEFFNNGTYKAFGGCNEMSVRSYKISDSRIFFEVGGTKKACIRVNDPTKNTVEFWDLAKVYSYELNNNGNVLLLRYKTDRGVEGIFRLQTQSSYKSVSWQKAVELIRTCQVKVVFQAHSLDVELTLADGSKVSTKEPRIDEVIGEARRVSDKCGPIPIATE